MISCREALGIILGEVKTLPARALPFSETLGLVLAEDITSGHDIPPFANSSMDGFSVRASDIKGASGDSPVRLRITGEMQAGDGRDLSLQPGTAIRIMTGAPVPGGSDTVVPKEETKTVGDTVQIRREFPEGRYVRPKGEDVRQGSKVLKAGLVIGPATLGFLASLGVSEVKVVPRPAVSVVGTGNELVEADEPLKPGQIRDSNSHSLVAQIDAMGARGSRVGVARDTKEDTLAKIRAALEADVVITIGGVSVGEYDFVNDVLAGLGAEQKFYKLRQEPGKPLAFWVLDGKPVFCLPGNPVSAMVCFEEYVRPALLKMMGRDKLLRPEVEAVLEEDFEKEPGKVYYLRVQVERLNGQYRARPTGPQGSGILTSLILADGIGVIPEDQSLVRRGDAITVQLITQPEDH